jgi:hypothetical protein
MDKRVGIELLEGKPIDGIMEMARFVATTTVCVHGEKCHSISRFMGAKVSGGHSGLLRGPLIDSKKKGLKFSVFNIILHGVWLSAEVNSHVCLILANSASDKPAKVA